MDKQTFAYLLLTCSHVDNVHHEWWESSCSSVIESFISLEGQADVVQDIWPFGWHGIMERVAPVQLTLGWDPRQHLLEVFDKVEVQPTYQFGDYGSEGGNNIIYFVGVPDKRILLLAIDSISIEQSPSPADRVRFDEVLIATAELAYSQDRGLLFIGDWGWDYEINSEYIEDPEIEVVLRQAGMKFFTRHA